MTERTLPKREWRFAFGSRVIWYLVVAQCWSCRDHGEGESDMTDASTSMMAVSGATTATIASAGMTTSTETTDASMPPLEPLGAVCDRDEECESGKCWLIPGAPTGGFCSECRGDVDCRDGGCTAPNVLLANPDSLWATCNDGALGDSCMSDAACEGDLVCAHVFDVPLLAPVLGCSACRTDGDCDQLLCSPVYDAQALGGYRDCILPGSLLLGEGCDVRGSGAEACASGFCVGVPSVDYPDIGVCSECANDANCPGMAACSAPGFGVPDGANPGTCG
jgi:hypothetical protein